MQYKQGCMQDGLEQGVGVAVGSSVGVGVKQIGQFMGSTGGSHLSSKRCDSSESSGLSDSATTVATNTTKTTTATSAGVHLVIPRFDGGCVTAQQLR